MPQKELIEVVRRRLAGYLTASRYVMITYNVHRAALAQARDRASRSLQ